MNSLMVGDSLRSKNRDEANVLGWERGGTGVKSAQTLTATTAGAVTIKPPTLNQGLTINGNGSGVIAIGSAAGAAINFQNSNASFSTAGLLACKGITNTVTQATSTLGWASTIGTVTVSTPMLTGTATWNASGISFYGIFQNITNTASAAGARHLELQTGGTEVFGVDVLGEMISSPTWGSSGTTYTGFKVNVNTTVGTAATNSKIFEVAQGGSDLISVFPNFGGPSNGMVYFGLNQSNFEDVSTTTSGTAPLFAATNIWGNTNVTLMALNTGVITTIASTCYVGIPPVAGTNQTITNAYSLYANGKTKVNDTVSSTTPSFSVDCNGSSGKVLTLLNTGTSVLTVDKNGTLASSGGHVFHVNAQSIAYTLTSSDYYVPVTAGASTIAVTLPAATGSGQAYIIKKVDSGAGAVTVTPNGTDKIDGASTFSLSAQWKYVSIIDGASGNWHIIANN